MAHGSVPGLEACASGASLSHGTLNAIFRIGDRLAARFPLEPGDAESTRRLGLSVSFANNHP